MAELCLWRMRPVVELAEINEDQYESSRSVQLDVKFDYYIKARDAMETDRFRRGRRTGAQQARRYLLDGVEKKKAERAKRDLGICDTSESQIKKGTDSRSIASHLATRYRLSASQIRKILKKNAQRR